MAVTATDTAERHHTPAAHAAPAPPAVAGAARRALRRLFGDLYAALQALFVQRPLAARRRRTAVQRRLLLGLELVAKLEEQVVYPALAEAEPGWAGDIEQAQQELELLRDLSLLTGRTTAANRDVSMAVLEGMTSLHVTRLDGLLARPGADNAPWDAMEREVRGLLGRWHAEVRRDGDIEDEDRDPVGLPPRGAHPPAQNALKDDEHP